MEIATATTTGTTTTTMTITTATLIGKDRGTHSRKGILQEVILEHSILHACSKEVIHPLTNFFQLSKVQSFPFIKEPTLGSVIGLDIGHWRLDIDSFRLTQFHRR